MSDRVERAKERFYQRCFMAVGVAFGVAVPSWWYLAAFVGGVLAITVFELMWATREDSP